MKLDPLFKVEANQLFQLSDNSKADISSFSKIQIKWSEVELQDEVYNEEYLAKLRDDLKILDEKNQFAIIIPVVDKALETPDQIELFTNTFNHTARRIKDCVSVAGIELPSQLIKKGISEASPVQDFIEVLSKKHAQYVYFAKQSDITDFNLTENISKTSIVMY